MGFRSFRRPSPALVISCVALFVALGGTGYAVVNLPKNSVGTKQLKRNAVTSPKVKNNAIRGADVNEATFSQVPSATNAGNADSLDGLDSSAFARPGGLVLVSAPWANWELVLPVAGRRTTVLANQVRLNSDSAATDVQVVLTPEIPVALHGKRLRALGAELCYDGEDGVLDFVDLQVYTHQNGNGALVNQATDDTDRADATCRVYKFATPPVLTEEQSLALLLTVDFAFAGLFEIGRTTFILEATGENATAPS